MSKPPVVLSLFDHTGEWARPFADADCEVIPIDIQNEGELGDVLKFSVQRLIDDLGIDDVDGILSANPCTDFTKSGALHWKKKDAEGSTAVSVELVHQTLRTVEFFKPVFWSIENPIGRIAKLVPQLTGPTVSRFTFDPCDFAGYLTFTPQDLERIQMLRDKERLALRFDKEDIRFIKEKNLYTKRTVLWGDFEFPVPKRMEPIHVCDQGSWIQMLGGKSAKTKNERSATPEGFALAYAQANAFTPERIEAGRMKLAARHLRDLEITNEAFARRELESEYGYVAAQADKVLEIARSGLKGRVDFTPETKRRRIRV